MLLPVWLSWEWKKNERDMNSDNWIQRANRYTMEAGSVVVNTALRVNPESELLNRRCYNLLIMSQKNCTLSVPNMLL